ncbi:MAG: ornithine aminotransferase [Hydrocarboniphaga sp.]|uniref:BON domain-containing protein n=1 Tax=Hydrocarboniphaga sp. TaxID=2033016 RepID=UPI002627C676|nr:BON domain-containing protein [Hydrocarboniphaga sp.]MDB5971210.1 ornithine aminotransferase [Hydrocarboniphaga sp.]
MDDLQLKQAVIDELESDLAIDATHVGVLVHHGVVTLGGYVASHAQKHHAEDVVRRVKGVKAVAQELDVKRQQTAALDDEQIAARAVRVIEWDSQLPRGAISVTVEQGRLSLSGVVDRDSQRRAAEADVAGIRGVTSVNNLITLLAADGVSQVQDEIRAAFERAADIEAERITVHVHSDHTVVLGGQVHSMIERAAAENAAWSAAGTMKVVNRIEIGH